MATYTNTKDVIGEQATLDGLIDHSLTEFTDTDVFELGDHAFYSNNMIKSITLPNVTKIGYSSFYDCSSLSDIHVGLEKSTMCTLRSTNAFANTGRNIILVPQNLVNTYKNGTNWSKYADLIYAEGDPDIPVWEESEITDTESEIATRVNNGTAASYYKYGQYKNVNFGTFGTFKMQIIGKNTDELADGDGHAQLTWALVEPFSKHRMNPSEVGTAGGWEQSEMRNYLNDTIWPLIPEVWRNIIKSVKKYSRGYDTSGHYGEYLTNDKIWLFSRREVNDRDESHGPVYVFAFPAKKYRIIKNTDGYNAYWWLRTTDGNQFCYIYGYDGSVSYSSPASNDYVVFGFCT